MNQEQLNEIFSRENTCYKITKDIVLDANVNLVMPVGCILSFEGGSIKSGTTGICKITGNNTGIALNGYRKFDVMRGVTLEGTFLDAGNVRPSLGGLDAGLQFFDVSLNKPIWWTGNTNGSRNGWIESDGAQAGIPRSGSFGVRPLTPYLIYEGFMYFINDTTTRFPIFAHLLQDSIKWYKADGTEYTGQ